MQVEFHQVQGLRAYRVMVVTPSEDEFSSTRARGRLRRTGITPRPMLVGGLQHDLARKIQDETTTTDALVLRPASPSLDTWMHEPYDETYAEAGYFVCRAAVEQWAPLLARELLAVVRVELAPERLAAIRSGSWRLQQELERGWAQGDPVACAEARSARRWLEDALGFWGVGLAPALQEWLPRHLDALERRRFDRSRAVTEPVPIDLPTMR